MPCGWLNDTFVLFEWRARGVVLVTVCSERDLPELRRCICC